MKNYIQPGDTLTIPAAEAVVSGQVVIAGEIVGIAAGDGAIGDAIDVTTRGVFELPKVGADAIDLGEAVYFDLDSGLATLTATDNVRIGVAVAAAGASVATVNVRLSGF